MATIEKIECTKLVNVVENGFLRLDKDDVSDALIKWYLEEEGIQLLVNGVEVSTAREFYSSYYEVIRENNHRATAKKLRSLNKKTK